jgi:hypothetical protein
MYPDPGYPDPGSGVNSHPDPTPGVKLEPVLKTVLQIYIKPNPDSRRGLMCAMNPYSKRRITRIYFSKVTPAVVKDPNFAVPYLPWSYKSI